MDTNIAMSIVKGIGAVINKYDLPAKEATALFGNTLSQTLSELTGKEYPTFDEWTAENKEDNKEDDLEDLKKEAESTLEELNVNIDQLVDNLDTYSEEMVFRAGMEAARGEKKNIDRCILIMSMYKVCKEMKVEPREFIKKYFKYQTDYYIRA